MEQHVFAFWLIVEFTTEKVLQFIMQLKSIYNKNLGFIQQKNVLLNTTERFKQKKSINLHFFAMVIFFLKTFSELPSKGLC